MSPTSLSSDDVFQETSARYRAVEPEKWLQRHPEAGSSWSSWPRSSYLRTAQLSNVLDVENLRECSGYREKL